MATTHFSPRHRRACQVPWRRRSLEQPRIGFSTANDKLRGENVLSTKFLSAGWLSIAYSGMFHAAAPSSAIVI
ncbi:hypothetical protein BJX62DRAFT_207565 [Aspergillus germanicus]